MKSVVKFAAVLVLACGTAQVTLADEMSSSSTESTSNGNQSTSETYKATSGPGGAKVSHTKTGAQANADGSVSAVKEHESHTLDAAGSTHHKSASATTVGADGSTTSTHNSVKTTKPE